MRRTGRRNPRDELLGVIREVRRRWRLRQLLQGMAVVLAAGFAVFLVSAFGIDRLRFDPTAVTVFRAVLYGSVALLAAYFLGRPLLRRVTDEQVALYLEEHEPSLQAAVLGAVERARDDASRAAGRRARDGAGRRGQVAASSALTGRLIQVAVQRARAVERGRRVERERLKRSTAWLAGVATTVLLVAALGSAVRGPAGSLLLAPWTEAEAANPYAIDVDPGNALVSRGSDLAVRAIPRGFETDDVRIAVRRGEAETWERLPMAPVVEGSGFEILLFDLDEVTEYVVEAEGVRSAVFRIDVADLPYVDRIDVEYRFPAYTGLPPRIVQDAGDLAALRGTEARLRIVSTLPAPSGRIVVDGRDEPIPLEPVEGGFEATLGVDRETFYRVELEGPGGRLVVASPDYLVEPLDDQPPVVTVSEPGRDTRATSIEEVYVEAEAEDDFGIGLLELVYSVNGGEERSVELHRTARGGAKQASGGHTFFLEEFGLEPGDVVSYYARAADVAASGARTESSDIYFVQIRPFDRTYRQADQGGAGGTGGGGMGGQLSEQQRQIVAATFRLVRDADEYPADEMRENLTTLTLLQGRLREQVEGLVQQMRTRGVGADPSFRAVFEELPLAAAAMREAEDRLGERATEEALAPEQRALQHLQRAEAAFREVQLSRGQGGSGGGGGAGPETQDLADLFELELDKLRNQYESVRRGEQRERGQEVDEALQKLEELARRQQQMNERARAGAGDGRQGQERLIEETEELARELERLSRDDRTPGLRESARRLREAADAMRRARGRNAEGASAGSQAADELRRARRLLENRQTAALESAVDDAVRRAERIVERQRELAEDVAAEGAAPDPDRVRGLRERKDELAAEVESLEAELDRLARESRREQPEASRALGEAAGSIRENKLREKILYSRGVVGARSPEYARNFEQEITRDAEELRERVSEARDAFRESDPRRLGRQLDEARDLVQGLESLRERIRQRTEQEEAAAGRQPGRGTAGERATAEGEGRGEAEGRGGETAAGFAPGGGGAGGLSPEDLRQLRREFGQRRADAERLRDGLRGEGVDVDALSDAIEALRRLQRGETLEDPDELERLQAAALRDLKDFEFALRRGLGAEIERLFLSGSDDVPPEYRDLVEEYFRALSEGTPRP